jgi:YfiH family protein
MFTQDKKVVWGFSEKKEGSMLFTLTNRELGFYNQIKYFKSLGLFQGYDIARPFLAHGNKLAVVDKNNFYTDIIKNVDGLLTKEKGLVLTVTAGDCLPIYFYDFKKEIVGLAHAGWKGTVSNIVGEMIEKMVSVFGTDPKDVLAHVGPHIHSCHFTIKDDILEKFSAYPDFVQKNKDDTYSVDLAGIVKSQLISKKVLAENITVDKDCTFCNPDKYFSFRRDKPAIVEAMVAYVGMK